MKKLLPYLPLHLLICLITGVCIQFYTSVFSYNSIKTLSLIGFILFLFWIQTNRILRTSIAFIFFFFLGIALVCMHDSRNHPFYYQNNFVRNAEVVLQIKKVLKPSFYADKYEAEVIKVHQKKTTGTLLLHIKKDSLTSFLQVDDCILLQAELKEILPPLNPNQFNYKAYLEKQNIYTQVFTEKGQFLKTSTNTKTLVGFSSKIRTIIQESLAKHAFTQDELAVINALLLGQRQNMSNELSADYQRAGAIHILAVSGLHVGALLLILSYVFKPLESIKHGKFLKAICIVLLLWFFAFIAGLSASVVRAVTMYTFVAIGMYLGRKTRVEFSLISSMFFLLVCKPLFLFDVGFQLSYLAVFSIVWLQPKIQAIWKPKYKSISFFWRICSVSIAAQIGVLPLSIYYFHQFPTLFWLSNLIIVPCLLFILIIGILVLLTAFLNILPDTLASFFASIISSMNTFVAWVSDQDFFLITNIYISFIRMLCWYLVVLLLVRFFIDKTVKKLFFLTLAVFFLQTIFLMETTAKTTTKELIVFQKSKHAIVGKRLGNTLLLQHTLDSLHLVNDFSLKSYIMEESIDNIKRTNFKNFIHFSAKNILLVDSLGVYKINHLQNPIVVLQHSPKINLERLIQTVKPSKIIADGSNYKSYVNRWQKTSLRKNILFYDTSKEGAFMLKE